MMKNIYAFCFLFCLIALPAWAQTVNTIAGNGQQYYDPDGIDATEAELGQVTGIAVDTQGNYYLTSLSTQKLYKVDTQGQLTTMVGPESSIGFLDPKGVALDAEGNTYVAVAYPPRILKVDPSGNISTVAGTGRPGYSGDGGEATAADLNHPSDLALDAEGNIYITDKHNHRIRKVNTNGIITTIAGTGQSGYNGDGGPATAAELNHPRGIFVDAEGNILFADESNRRIRKIDTSGTITTIAGTGERGFSGDEGPATDAQLQAPFDLTLDPQGNLYFTSENRIRKIDTSGTITTIAGTGEYGFSGDGGPATDALLFPHGITLDAEGNILFADNGNSRIRKIDTSGTITTVASTNVMGQIGDDGPATSARLNEPYNVRVDAEGNVFILDIYNHRIRKVDTSGIITTVAGTGEAGYSGDGGPATDAQLNEPEDLEIDSLGNLFIVDTRNHRIRKIDTAGTITTIAGTGETGFSGDGGPATEAAIQYPNSIALDEEGNLFFSGRNHRIRKIDTSGTITTIAGTGEYGFSGDGGPATDAQLVPYGITLDAEGNIFFADYANSRIRKIDTAGIITTIAGTGEFGFSGDGGPAIDAQLYAPLYLTIDAQKNLYFTTFDRIRKVDVNGMITTVAGSYSGFSGDGGDAINADFNQPTGITTDASGHVYIADRLNMRIRKITDHTAPSAYQVAFDSAFINSMSDLSALSFSYSNAEPFTHYEYIIEGSHGDSNLTGSGLIQSDSGQFTGLDISNFEDGTLTLRFTLTDPAGNAGAVATATIEKDTEAPSGYTVSFDQTSVNHTTDQTALSFTFENAEYPTTYDYILSSTGGGQEISGNGTLDLDTGQVTNIDVSALNEGFIQLQTILYDQYDNPSDTVVATIEKDVTFPVLQVQDLVDTLETNGLMILSEDDLLVSVSDNMTDSLDIALSLDQDTLSSSGEYSITLTATDRAGNSTSEVATVRVYKRTQAISFAALPSKTYGDERFLLTATTDSELEITYVSSDESIASVSGDSLTIYHTGTITLTATQAGNDTFMPAADVSQQLEILPDTLIVTADSFTRPYGSENPSFTLSYEGFGYEDTEADLSVVPVASAQADHVSEIGDYEISVAGGQDENYIFQYVSGNLTVEKAIITVTAEDASRLYGEENPAFTLYYYGFANRDTKQDLDVMPVASTLATDTSATGEYVIQISGGEDDHYQFDYVPGTLHITKMPIIVTANYASKIYGDQNPPLTLHYSGFVNGDTEADLSVVPVASTEATVNSVAGEYAISVSGGEDEFYEFIYVDGTLAVIKAMLFVYTRDERREEGEANPAFEIVYGGFRNAETAQVLAVAPTANCAADEKSLPGEYTIELSGGEAQNYQFSYIHGTLVVEPLVLGAGLQSEALKLYPNPTRDKLNVQLDRAATVSLLNLTGETLMQVENTRGTTLNLEQLPKGLYIVRIAGPDYFKNIKILKQ